MTQESQIVAIVVSALSVFFVTLILSLTFYNLKTNALIAQMVAAGTDPFAAACSLHIYSSSECLTMSMRKL